MIKRVQLIRHTKSAADLFLGLSGEVTINTTDNANRVHDGATLGGHEMARKDVANVPAATGVVDGKMTASQASDLSTVKSDFAAHEGAGGATHADAVAGGADGFITGADQSKLDGIEPGATIDQTAGEILASLLTVDGAGSGLDADLLDGENPTAANTADTIMRRNSAGRSSVISPSVSGDIATKGYVDGHLTAAAVRALGFFDITNDGASSGLDADILDGQQPASTASGNTVVKRDSAGRTKFVSPSASDDVAIKSYVDARLEGGTKMLFVQAGAPNGWSKDMDQDNKALRIVNGTGGATGGATNFDSIFGSSKITGSTSPGVASHTHADTFSVSSDGAHVHGLQTWALGSGGQNIVTPGANLPADNNSNSPGASSAPDTVSAGAHTHPLAGSVTAAGSGSAHTHTRSMDIRFVDVIKCTKN